jgi:hypothetical protein
MGDFLKNNFLKSSPLNFQETARFRMSNKRELFKNIDFLPKERIEILKQINEIVLLVTFYCGRVNRRFKTPISQERGGCFVLSLVQGTLKKGNVNVP